LSSAIALATAVEIIRTEESSCLDSAYQADSSNNPWSFFSPSAVMSFFSASVSFSLARAHSMLASYFWITKSSKSLDLEVSLSWVTV
jgi:hypothetical protein